MSSVDPAVVCRSIAATKLNKFIAGWVFEPMFLIAKARVFWKSITDQVREQFQTALSVNILSHSDARASDLLHFFSRKNPPLYYIIAGFFIQHPFGDAKSSKEMFMSKLLYAASTSKTLLLFLAILFAETYSRAMSIWKADKMAAKVVISFQSGKHTALVVQLMGGALKIVVRTGFLRNKKTSLFSYLFFEKVEAQFEVWQKRADGFSAESELDRVDEYLELSTVEEVVKVAIEGCETNLDTAFRALAAFMVFTLHGF